jgi:predicted metal-binding membrane protein
MPRLDLPKRPQRHPLARPATVLLVGLAAAWAWIVAIAVDMYGPMTGASAWMMTAEWTWPHLALLWAMWAVMMAAMMLPSAWPMLRTYAGFEQTRGGTPATAGGLYVFAIAYIVVWAAFSLAATILQRLLASLLLLSPMMESTSPTASAAALALAGAYQFTPVKQRCLTGCTAPLTFVLRWWEAGLGGAWRMGLRHGALCVGCCWALMLLLFVGGVMNLVVIVALTAFVLAERGFGWGARGSRAAGALLLAAAAWLLLR